jgi:hypothetical protein
MEQLESENKMYQPHIDPFIRSGSIDFNFDDDHPSTWPSPQMGLLKIIDKFEPLFISATWTIVATVDGDVIAKSKESGRAHTETFIKRWSRQLIRTKYEQLRRLGVDAEGEYVKLGGNLEDLQP